MVKQEFRQTLTPSQEAHKLLNVGFEYFMQQAPSRFGIPKLLRNVLLCLVGEETRKIAMQVFYQPSLTLTNNAL